MNTWGCRSSRVWTLAGEDSCQPSKSFLVRQIPGTLKEADGCCFHMRWHLEDERELQCVSPPNHSIICIQFKVLGLLAQSRGYWCCQGDSSKQETPALPKAKSEINDHLKADSLLHLRLPGTGPGNSSENFDKVKWTLIEFKSLPLS